MRSKSGDSSSQREIIMSPSEHSSVTYPNFPAGTYIHCVEKVFSIPSLYEVNLPYFVSRICVEDADRTLNTRYRTLGLTLRKVKTVIIDFYEAKFYGKSISGQIFVEFLHLVSEIAMSKMSNLVKISNFLDFPS